MEFGEGASAEEAIAHGLRVEAVWAPEGERGAASTGIRGMGLGEAVKSWRPTGEPDVPREHLAAHIL